MMTRIRKRPSTVNVIEEDHEERPPSNKRLALWEASPHDAADLLLQLGRKENNQGEWVVREANHSQFIGRQVAVPAAGFHHPIDDSDDENDGALKVGTSKRCHCEKPNCPASPKQSRSNLPLVAMALAPPPRLPHVQPGIVFFPRKRRSGGGE